MPDHTSNPPNAAQEPHGTVLDGLVTALLADLCDEVSVLSSAEAGPRYTRDWGDRYGVAAPVVRPRTPEALAEVVRRFSSHRIAMVVQGGMSGLAGGAAPMAQEVVVSTELLRTIEDCDVYGATMTVQAGVTLQAVQEEAERHGLFYPVDLGARGSCFIGGNIATNAGGNRVLQYGMTRASVLGLEVVLPDGRCISHLSQVVKDNAGYDLKQLFIGSEGTLGIVTRAVLRLQPLPRERITAAFGLDRLEQVLETLVASRASFGPSLTSFEVMWKDFHGFVTGHLGLGRDPFQGEADFLVLLEISSFDADTARERERVAQVLAVMADRLGTEKVVLAQSLKEAAELWRVRDASGEVARSLGRYLSFDVSIPISRLQEALAHIEHALAAIDPALRKMTYGHLGDGNLHLLVACEGATARAVEAAVYAVVGKYRGSISAEHGIGVSKRQALAEQLPAVELTTMRQIKRALDPLNLLNRDRVVSL